MEEELEKNETVNMGENMSKSEELELRKYFIRALSWVAAIAVTIIISAGGFLYKKMDERVSAIEEYRLVHEKETNTQLREYSDRVTSVEHELKEFKILQEERLKVLDTILKSQREIVEAVKAQHLN